MGESRRYQKSNSFQDFLGGDSDTRAVEASLAAYLRSTPGEGPRAQVVSRALAELADDAKGTWTLSKMSCSELRSVPSDRWFDYVYYRYRYDRYPASRQLDAWPPLVQIEPTSICNFRCVFCYQISPRLTAKESGHMGMMKLDLFKSIVDELEGNVFGLTLASRGEPFLNPEIVEMLRYAGGKFLSFKTNSNISKLTEAHCHAVFQSGVSIFVISADEADDERYSRLRVNGKLQDVLARARMLRDVRDRHYPDSKTVIRVSGVRVNDSQDIDAMSGVWGDIVDEVVFVSYNPWENPYDADPTGIDQPCSDLWRRMFIWWDGRCNPCDVDYLSELSVGTTGQGVSEVWRSEAYQSLRAKHLAGKRGSVNPCRGCAVV